MQLVYIGVGSNLCDPIVQVRNAIMAIANLPDICVKKVSSLYHSVPLGPANQPDYINAVVGLTTSFEPMGLLSHLQAIELQQGRKRDGLRWGARVIDLDILLFKQVVMQVDHLTIPHKGLTSREFVLCPLAEIAPELVLPDGQRIQELLKACPKRSLKKIVDAEIGEMI